MVVPSPEGAQLISVSAQKMLTLHIAHCIQDMVTYAFFSGFWQETNKTCSHQNGNLNGGRLHVPTNADNMLL